MAKMKEVDVIINKDRISELPNHLIESILDRISTNEAARTSILSTKWRHIWTNITKLELDKQFFEGLTPNKRTESSEFVEVVDTILMLHNGTIQEFDIYIPFTQTPNMDLWILYLSRNGVKELTISNSYPQSYKLPSYIFSCDQLTFLDLFNCVIDTPADFTSFFNLRTLILEKVSLCTNTGSLISMLSSLRHFYLRLCLGVENIKNLPQNLIWFEVLGSQKAHWQWFHSKIKIPDLSIFLCEEVKNVDVQGKIFKLNYFLSNLPNLMILELDGFALKFLAAGGFKEIPHLSHKLKRIELVSLSFNDLDQVSCALCLLKSSPNLVKLYIQAFSVSNDGLEERDLSYIVNMADSDLKLNRLRSATFFFLYWFESRTGFS